MHHDASKLQVPSLGWLQIVGFAGIVELNIYNEQVNDEPGDLHSWHLISGRNWCGHVNLTQYPMCHQADHWILWHVDRTLQTNAETVKTYVNSRLASFHFAPSISFNDLMVFFLCSCFELELNKQVIWILHFGYIVPICSNHPFFLDERGSYSQHGSDQSVRKLWFWFPWSPIHWLHDTWCYSTDSTPLSIVKFFYSLRFARFLKRQRHAKAIKAQQTMLCFWCAQPEEQRHCWSWSSQEKTQRRTCQWKIGHVCNHRNVFPGAMDLHGDIWRFAWDAVRPNHPKLDDYLRF